MSKAYVEARAEHGESGFSMRSWRRSRAWSAGKVHNPEELRDQGLDFLTEVTALLEDKATAEEREDYRRFVLTVASKVAAAHGREGSR